MAGPVRRPGNFRTVVAQGRSISIPHISCRAEPLRVTCGEKVGCLGLSLEFITRLELTSINFCLILFDADLAIGPTQFRGWP